MRRLNGFILSTATAAIIGATGENAEAASAKAHARAYADTANYSLADFNYGIGSTQWGGYWYSFNDTLTPSADDSTVMGNSTLTSTIAPAPNYPNNDSTGQLDPRSFPVDRSGDTSLHAFRMGFALGNRKLGCGPGCSYEPYVGWGMNFNYQTPPNDTLDLTGATAISFWAKSDSDTVTVSFSVNTRSDSANTPNYSQTFRIGPTWAKYTCNLVASTVFKQPTYGLRKPFLPQHATGLGFGFNRGDNSKHPTDGITIDDINFEHWTDIPPDPDAIRALPRASAAHAGWRVEIHGSQIRLVRRDGDRLIPLNLNGRALPAR